VLPGKSGKTVWKNVTQHRGSLHFHGTHGQEGCYAAIRLGDRLVGAPDRAPSYPVNPWEYPLRRHDSGYTYFFPLDESMVGQNLEVVLLGMNGGGLDLRPAVWITAKDLPFTVAP